MRPEERGVHDHAAAVGLSTSADIRGPGSRFEAPPTGQVAGAHGARLVRPWATALLLFPRWPFGDPHRATWASTQTSQLERLSWRHDVDAIGIVDPPVQVLWIAVERREVWGVHR